MTLKRSFKFSVDWVNSGPRGAILGKFESSCYRPIKHSQTLTNTHRHSQTLSDTLRHSQTRQRMSTGPVAGGAAALCVPPPPPARLPVTFDVTFFAQDILRDPWIRKALREREDSYLDNISWLDQDLAEKMEKRYQENIAWLDQDLAEKRYQENIVWLDQDLANKIDEEAAVTIQKYFRRMTVMNTMASAARGEGLLTMGPSGNPRIPKIWHCGHAPGSASAEELPEVKKARMKRVSKQYEDGLVNNTCIIGHRYQQENERGHNTRKQFMEFQREAKEGDIIFNHHRHRLTHYGFYTGKITKRPSPAPEDAGQGWYHSFISVYGWIPLPEVMKGVGRNCTLYEVTPTNKKGMPTKNFQNYIRSSLGCGIPSS